MIARSSDGGQTWQLKHQIADGEVLLGVPFIDEKTAYASGTNGLILWTKDGGETWTSTKAGTETIVDISFGDDKHGIRHFRSVVEITSDAGPPGFRSQNLKRTRNHFIILMEVEKPGRRIMCRASASAPSPFMMENTGQSA